MLYRGPKCQCRADVGNIWINEIQHELTIPTFKPRQSALKIQPPSTTLGAQVENFVIEPPFEITAPITITVPSTEIQYSQLVLLNFASLTGPHVSCATLNQNTAIIVPASAFD